ELAVRPFLRSDLDKSVNDRIAADGGGESGEYIDLVRFDQLLYHGHFAGDRILLALHGDLHQNRKGRIGEPFARLGSGRGEIRKIAFEAVFEDAFLRPSRLYEEGAFGQGAQADEKIHDLLLDAEVWQGEERIERRHGDMFNPVGKVEECRFSAEKYR